MADNYNSLGEAPHWTVSFERRSDFVDRLIDLSVEANLVPDSDFHYKWQEYGDWQFSALKEYGLAADHKLLDIGCGPLRLGLKAIPYLNDGNYYGIDAFQKYLDLGSRLIKEFQISKHYNVILSNQFEFEKFEVTFDYAIAQSVFTHMSEIQIRQCMTKLKAVMKSGGVFVFTYILTNQQRGIMYYGLQPMIAPLLKSAELFKKIAESEGIKFEQSPMSHPAQLVGIFRF